MEQNKSPAYIEGYRAFGQNIRINPYYVVDNPQEYSDWIIGWKDAWLYFDEMEYASMRDAYYERNGYHL